MLNMVAIQSTVRSEIGVLFQGTINYNLCYSKPKTRFKFKLFM